VIVDADNRRVIDDLRRRKMDVIAIPFDGPIRTGGGLRCAHHPLLRESVLV
jgi:glycine amidinotransferase